MGVCVMRKIARQLRDCIIGTAQRWDPQELLDGRGKLVWPVFGERVERVAQACLSENLERGAPHPVQHVELNPIFANARLDALFDSIARLNNVRMSRLYQQCMARGELKANVPCG